MLLNTLNYAVPFKEALLQVTSLQVLLFSAIFLFLLWLLPRPKQTPLPPGPWGFPILGHLPLLGTVPSLTFIKWQKKYGDVFMIRMGAWSTVVINGSDAVREALIDKGDDFAGRPPFDSNKYIGEGKSMAFGPYGDRWRVHKKIARSALRSFTQKPDQELDNAIIREALNLVDDLATGKPLIPKEAVNIASGAVIYAMCFGATSSPRDDKEFINFLSQQQDFQDFQSAGGNPSDLIPILKPFTYSTLKRFISISTCFQNLHNRHQKEHLDTYKEGQVRDITDALIQASNEYDTKEMRSLGLSRRHVMNTTIELVGAGMGTITNTLDWLILYMAVNPEIQRKAQDEIDRVLGQRLPEPADRKSLPYLESIFHETLRHSVALPFLLPHYTTNDTSLNGYHISKDTLVFINMWSVTRDPKVWDKPEEFMPERFLDEQGQLDRLKSEMALPFGGGRRRCLAETLGRIESFLFSAILLQKCNIKAPPGVDLNVEHVVKFTTEPKAYEVVIQRRDL